MPHLKLLLSTALLAGATHSARAADLPWLHADGPKVVDDRGRQVTLNGFNLGAWLVEEMWMMPYAVKAPEGSEPIQDYTSLWKTVEQRFGAAEANRLRAAMRNAWITEADFKRIKSSGVNCVRLPFTYDLLQEPDGIQWLDQAVEWARKNELYVILDLHGAPGRQNHWDHSGQSDVNQLFTAEKYVQQTEAVWRQIAQRYKDRPEVAGYDLLNEPVGAPDSPTLYLVSDRLYRTIRAVDPKHIVIVEDGYKGPDSFPRPAVVGWHNVMLSWHHYNFGAKTEADQTQGLTRVANQGRSTGRTRQAPFYLGEVQVEPFGTPASLAVGLGAMQRAGHSWTLWNYKVVMRDGSGGLWGWYRSTKPAEVLDFYRDSAPELLRKAEQMRTENLTENTGMTAMLKTVTQIQPLPPSSLQEVVATARISPVTWRYTLDKPADNWFTPNFDAASWKEGAAGFGGPWTFEGQVRSEWKTNDIWLRREFTLPENVDMASLQLVACHDDDAEVYINGVLAVKLDGYTHSYDETPVEPTALAALKRGKNLLAVYCHQGSGDQYIDVGILGRIVK